MKHTIIFGSRYIECWDTVWFTVLLGLLITVLLICFKLKSPKLNSSLICKRIKPSTNRINHNHWIPPGNYMFKVNNKNTKTRCEICSKLTIKIPERRHWRRSGIFIVNFEHISPRSCVSVVIFEQVNANCAQVYMN